MLFRRSKPVPRSQELIFLDADDDLGTIRSKLEASAADDVFVVVPRRSSLLRTPLEFRIFARIANELSSETILVTDDSVRRMLAHQEGFRTRRSLRTLKHLMLAPGKRPPRLVLPDWVPVPSVWSALIYLVALALIAGGLLVAVPQMMVVLVPQTTQIDTTLRVIADPAAKTADPSLGILPAETMTQRVDVGGSLPIPADRPIGDAQAKGEVTVTSSRLATASLPKGTVVRVDGGPKFTTDQAVSIAPRAPTRVAITATNPGAESNVSPGAITQFEGAGLNSLDVTNQRPISGGTDRLAQIVTAADQAQLRDQLLLQARDQLLQQFRTRAGSDKSVPDVSVTVSVVTEQYDQQPGTESDQLTGRITASGTGTDFVNTAFNDLVGMMLTTGSGPKQKLGSGLKTGPPQVVKVEGQRVTLTTHATGVIQREFDAAAIQQALVGKSRAEAISHVSALTGQAEPAVVSVQPSWAPRAFRVQVDVRGPK